MTGAVMSDEQFAISLLGAFLGQVLQVGLIIVAVFAPVWIRRSRGMKTMLLVFMSLYVICLLSLFFGAAFLSPPPQWLKDPYPSGLLIGLLGNFVMGSMFGFMFEIARWLYMRLVR